MNLAQSSRFKDALWFPKEETHVLIGGAGGIGTWLSILLARANFKPIIYDFDTIEEHNIGGQLFAKRHIGTKKVNAVADVLRDFADCEITALDEKFTSDSMGHWFMFSAFDNMQARKDMFERWKEMVKSGLCPDNIKPVFIDGRLTAEQLQVFCVTPDRIDEYEKQIFDDSEVEEAPCTMKQTSHCAAMIASHMVGFFTNHLTNTAVGDDDRALPFFYEYFIPISYTNNEVTT